MAAAGEADPQPGIQEKVSKCHVTLVLSLYACEIKLYTLIQEVYLVLIHTDRVIG